MNKLKVILTVLLAIFVFTGCSLKKNDEAIVKVNDTVITKNDFEKAYDSVTSNNMFSQMGIDLKNDKENVFSLMMQEKVISELIVNALVNEEMEKLKITVSKDELDQGEKEILAKFGSKEQFIEILKSNGVTYEKFRKDLEEEIKLKKFVDAIGIVSIGESEAKKYYMDNMDKFRYPKKVRASHILIMANPEQIKAKLKEENKDMNTLRQQAEALQAKVKKAPSTFAKIAKENSQDVMTATRGGDLGFFAKDEMVEAFSNKAFNMKPNTISEVIQTPYGFHIIMVTDRKEAGTYTFAESKEDIINYLESQDKVDILKNKIESLRKDAKIEYLDENYNPDKLQEKIKTAAANNPQAQEVFGQNPEEQKQ